jgi:hypothetical protein
MSSMGITQISAIMAGVAGGAYLPSYGVHRLLQVYFPCRKLFGKAAIGETIDTKPWWSTHEISGATIKTTRALDKIKNIVDKMGTNTAWF